MKNQKGFTVVELLVVTGAVLLVMAPTIVGLYLAFKASIILGIVAAIVEPSPAVFGICALFGHSDICQKLAAWLNLPF